jgi:hypothetical protein
MIAEPSDKCGSAALLSQNIAYTLVFITWSNCSVLISSIPSCDIWYAALLTRMSSPPSSLTVRSTSFEQWLSSRMSPGNASARRSASSTKRQVSRASASSLSR